MTRGRFKLLAFPSHLTDAPSFYRCLGPLAALCTSRPNLQVSVVEHVQWPNMALNDGVMMQRPHSATSLEIMRMAGQHGLPTWVEYDDDVFAVPVENPGHEMYMNEETQQVIPAILALADVVTVSTEALAVKMRRYAKDVHVVPNALMTNMVGSIPPHGNTQRRNLLLWRGSITHQRDLDCHLDAMAAAAERNPETQWVFQGLDRRSYNVLARIPRAIMSKALDPVMYFAWLTKVLPRATIVPLHDSPFNRAKSNIAYIESTHAGGITIAPDWDEWRRPGVLTYRNSQELGTRIDQALQMSAEQHAALWKEAARHVTENLTIDFVNQKRSAVVDELERMSGNARWRDIKRASIPLQ